MGDYAFPLLLLALLFVGFGLVHGNGKGAGGCRGCTSCADRSQCEREQRHEDAPIRD